MKRKKYFKFALVGATCTGKTSIIDHLKDKYKNNSKIVFVEEGARAYFAANPDIKDRGAWKVQTGIRDFVFNNEKKAGKNSPSILVCDRSIIDSAVYMEAHGDKKGADKLFKTVAPWVLTYNKILMLDPTEVPYQMDEIRNEGEDFRNHVHDTFVKFFRRNNIKYELVKGTLQERIAYVEGVLKLSPYV